MKPRALFQCLIVLFFTAVLITMADALPFIAPVDPGSSESCSERLGPDTPPTLKGCDKPHCGRLIGVLREAAQTQDAKEMLIRSARGFVLSQSISGTGVTAQADAVAKLLCGWVPSLWNCGGATAGADAVAQLICRGIPSSGNCQDAKAQAIAVAQALADLSVTGQAAFRSFQKLNPTTDAARASLVEAVTVRLKKEGFVPNAEDVRGAVEKTVRRAMEVGWAIRGPEQHRAERRAGLGWIAVSGEDDPPHRPVNIPSAPYPQYNMMVNVKGRSVETRYILASKFIHDTRSADLSTIPVDPVHPKIDGDIILFIHGDSSRAEEALDLIPQLQDRKPLTVIAMDLPSSGYASMIDHTEVAPWEKSNWNTGYPILEFIEEFVVSFVSELEARQPGVQKQIVAIIGGSLGGNMALRLGERNPPWLRNIVSWSPASSWISYGRAHGTGIVLPGSPEAKRGLFFDALKSEMIQQTRRNMNTIESSASRETHFDRWPDGQFSSQSGYWYSDKWPCREAALEADRQYNEEVYNPTFRRWHWRQDFEQLLFSHWDSDEIDNRIDPAKVGTPRYAKILRPLLLAAGEDDNKGPVNLYDRTIELSKAMTMVRGSVFFVQKTGHSIHKERPRRFSNEIISFLYPEFPPQCVTDACKGCLVDECNPRREECVNDPENKRDPKRLNKCGEAYESCKSRCVIRGACNGEGVCCGNIASNGTCQGACAADANSCPISCTSGTACSGKCVELTSDTNNCGVCGKRCPNGHECQGSVCKKQPAGGGPTCQSNEKRCGDDCIPKGKLCQ